jgi:Carboxypeptidase regulatory-like domain
VWGEELGKQGSVRSLGVLTLDDKSQNRSALEVDNPGVLSISGTVVDQTGAIIGGVEIRLTREGQSESQEALSTTAGQFSFGNVAAGSLRLTITLALGRPN